MLNRKRRKSKRNSRQSLRDAGSAAVTGGILGASLGKAAGRYRSEALGGARNRSARLQQKIAANPKGVETSFDGSERKVPSSTQKSRIRRLQRIEGGFARKLRQQPQAKMILGGAIAGAGLGAGLYGARRLIRKVRRRKNR